MGRTSLPRYRDRDKHAPHLSRQTGTPSLVSSPVSLIASLVDQPDVGRVVAAARLGGVAGAAHVAGGRAVPVVVGIRTAPTSDRTQTTQNDQMRQDTIAYQWTKIRIGKGFRVRVTVGERSVGGSTGAGGIPNTRGRKVIRPGSALSFCYEGGVDA